MKKFMMKKYLILFLLLMSCNAWCAQKPKEEKSWGDTLSSWGKWAGFVAAPPAQQPKQTPQRTDIEYFRSLIVCPIVAKKSGEIDVSLIKNEYVAKWLSDFQIFKKKWLEANPGKKSQELSKQDNFLDAWQKLGTTAKQNLVKATFQGLTLLHYAALGGQQPEIVKQLLAGGAAVNAVVERGFPLEGFTPLHLAAMMGHEEVIKLLIENGADITIVVDGPVDKGSTVLHFVSKNLNLVKLIVDLSIANKDVKDCKFLDELFLRKNSYGKTFYELDGNPTNILDYVWKIAVEKNLIETIKNILSLNRLTPGQKCDGLYTVVKNNLPEIVNIIITHGGVGYAAKTFLSAELLEKKYEGKTIIELASDNLEVLKIFWFTAALYNLCTIIEAILKTKPDFDVNQEFKDSHENVNGMTAVHIASLLGLNEILKILFTKKADLNKVVGGNGKYYGFMSLHLAVINNHPETVKLLLENGADINAKIDRLFNTKYGQFTALYLAAQLLLEEIIDILLVKSSKLSTNHPYGSILHLVIDGIRSCEVLYANDPKLGNANLRIKLLGKIIAHAKGRIDIDSLLNEIDLNSEKATDLALKLPETNRTAVIMMLAGMLSDRNNLLQYCSKENVPVLKKILGTTKFESFWYRVRSWMSKAASCFRPVVEAD
jgi:ankyrin repeat protein